MKCFLQQPKRPTTALPTNSIQSTGIPGDTLQEKLYSCLSIPAQTHRPPPPRQLPPGEAQRSAREKAVEFARGPRGAVVFQKISAFYPLKAQLSARFFFKQPLFSTKEQSLPSPKSIRD